MKTEKNVDIEQNSAYGNNTTFKNPYLEEYAGLYNVSVETVVELSKMSWIERRTLEMAKASSVQDYFDNHYVDRWRARDILVHKYSWAIPCKEAIEKLVEYSPLIEVCAGNGYWAHLVAQLGGDIACYDSKPWDSCWHPVKRGTYRSIAAPKNKDRTLFLCWPPYNEEIAFKCLRAYRGRYVIYVGESGGGCTGDARFEKTLNDRFELIENVEIPQWDGIHDHLMVWRRNES